MARAEVDENRVQRGSRRGPQAVRRRVLGADFGPDRGGGERLRARGISLVFACVCGLEHETPHGLAPGSDRDVPRASSPVGGRAAFAGDDSCEPSWRERGIVAGGRGRVNIYLGKF